MTRTIALIGAAAAGAALISASPAASQTWTAQPSSDAQDTAAVAEWDSGAAMIARCGDDGFRLLIQLVAPLEGSVATMQYAFDEDEDGAKSRLSVLAPGGGAVFARHPADFARALLSARSLDMTITDGETPQQRYVLEAPADPAVLGDVLAACGEPLTPPPAVTVIPNDEPFEQPTRSEIAALYPDRAMRRGIAGRARVECILATDGRLEDCLTAWEDPEGEGFGDATIALVEGRRGSVVTEGGMVAGSALRMTLYWGPW